MQPLTKLRCDIIDVAEGRLKQSDIRKRFDAGDYGPATEEHVRFELQWAGVRTA